MFCDDVTTMAPFLTQEIRKQVIVLRYEQCRTAQEIADIVGCNERNIYNILHLYCDFGQVNSPFASRKGRPRTLSQGDLTVGISKSFVPERDFFRPLFHLVTVILYSSACCQCQPVV